MRVSVGTFNVNNLFSRYNFELKATAEGLGAGNVPYTKVREAVDELGTQRIEYRSAALHRKDPADRQAVADRIRAMDLDVVALQEVEDIDTLRYFADHELDNGIYPYLMLIEGNDPRLINVAVMSKYPIGPSTTWQTAFDPYKPSSRVFSRDLLQAEILSPDRQTVLFTLFVNHFKSHYVPFFENQLAGAKAANESRREQAETAALIIERNFTPESRYIVLGDFNDPPDSAFLRPLVDNFDLKLVNGLLGAKETRPAPKSNFPPPSPLWTHRSKLPNQPPQYELLDQIWLSEGLAPYLQAAFIDRRIKIAGDGSDHDPAWVELEL